MEQNKKGKWTTENTGWQEVKSWFEERIEKKALPTKLYGEYKYYRDVPWTAQLYIDQVEGEIKRWGIQEVKKRSVLAKTGKHKLIELYNELQNKEAWDVEPDVKFRG